MKHSEQIGEIAAALSKAQGAMQAAIFDKLNPHYKSKYATLTSIMSSVKKPLSENGLSVVQVLSGSAENLFVVTTLLHSSGQWLQDDGVPLILDKQNMQGLGSAITYAKRYGLSAMLLVVSDEDDDAESTLSGLPEPQIKNVTHVSAGTNTTANVPQSVVSIGAPACCGKPMIVSKYQVKGFDVQPWYCLSCKSKKPRTLEDISA